MTMEDKLRELATKWEKQSDPLEQGPPLNIFDSAQRDTYDRCAQELLSILDARFSCGHPLIESETSFYERHPDLDVLCHKCSQQARAR